jgi:hypothetical protein
MLNNIFFVSDEQTISMKLEESDIIEFKAFFGANVPAIFIVVSSTW